MTQLQKNIVATIYLKDGYAVEGPNDLDSKIDALTLARYYNDSGVDKIICYDLSDTVKEKEKNLKTLADINRNIDIKTCGGGNIKRVDDVKKFLYAGCIEVIFNGAKLDCAPIIKEASERFGSKRMLVSIHNMNFVFKTKEELKGLVHEYVLYDKSLISSLEEISDVPYIVEVDNYSDEIPELLKSEKIRGISGSFINNITTDIMQIKSDLSDAGIEMDNFEPRLEWSDLKPDEDGIIPVCVQDYVTGEVILVAYMNEEAYNTTLRKGRMTYYSRSKDKVITRGLETGNVQYVKSLTADSCKDSLLAKVSQVGDCDESGSHSTFINDIVEKEITTKTPISVFESVYGLIKESKINPEEENYVSEMFDKGVDEMLTNIGRDMTNIIIAAKSEDDDEIKYSLSDFLYNAMILMVEKGLTWDDITRELLQH